LTPGLKVAVANRPGKAVTNYEAQQDSESDPAQDVEVESNDTHTELKLLVMETFSLIV
jgi:hypothetical protein